MKVKFVNGVAGNRGAKVIFWHGRSICGRYSRHLYENKKEIIVVKQRSIWFTILIFIHELLHWANREMFRGNRRKRINIWIDGHIIRSRDKK